MSVRGMTVAILGIYFLSLYREGRREGRRKGRRKRLRGYSKRRNFTFYPKEVQLDRSYRCNYPSLPPYIYPTLPQICNGHKIPSLKEHCCKYS